MSFLFVDRILQLTPAKLVRGIKHITRDDTYLTTDSQGNACFIPSLIGETLGQLAAWNVMFHHDFKLRPVAGIVGSAVLQRPARVGETLVLESFIDALDERAVNYHSKASINGEPVFTIEGALGPLLPMTDFIAEAKARNQFNSIYHPDEAFEPSSLNQEKVALLTQDEVFIPNIAPMQFDRILQSEPGITLVAEKRITKAAPYFPDHFPLKPVLPMTVLLECQLNLSKDFVKMAGLSYSFEKAELRKIKMNEFVKPGDVVLCHLKIKEQTDEQLVLSLRSEVDCKRVCVVELVLLKDV